MTEKTYPVDYRKGDDVRQARSRADETKLKFEGFRPISAAAHVPVVKDEADHREPSYEELQNQAKELQDLGHDLKATGTYEDLLAAVTTAAQDQADYEAAQ